MWIRRALRGAFSLVHRGSLPIGSFRRYSETHLGNRTLKTHIEVVFTGCINNIVHNKLTRTPVKSSAVDFHELIYITRARWRRHTIERKIGPDVRSLGIDDTQHKTSSEAPAQVPLVQEHRVATNVRQL